MNMYTPLRPLLYAAFVAAAPIAAAAGEYTLTPADGAIGFELGSTLHMVHGNAKQFTVTVNIPDAGMPGEAAALVTIPAKGLDTDNGRRDEKMRNECLEAEKYPNITFETTGMENLPPLPFNGESFSALVKGKLTIHGVTRETAIPVTVKRTDKGALIAGSVPVAFIKDYNIVDPSIFVFRVEKEAKVIFSLALPAPLFKAAHAAAKQ
ncbi:MAG: YceI family protein [Nitrospinae bacterium]|nr:YceI family protein [Nitrospinota bacterium]